MIMSKKIIALLMSISMVLFGSIPSFAAEAKPADSEPEIHLMWENTDTVEVALNFTGTRGDCTAIIHGKKGTSKITATALLKRVTSNGTVTVKAWTGLSASGDSFYFDKSYYVSSGYSYIFEINAKIYRNGVAESVSVSDSDYCG